MRSVETPKAFIRRTQGGMQSCEGRHELCPEQEHLGSVESKRGAHTETTRP